MVCRVDKFTDNLCTDQHTAPHVACAAWLQVQLPTGEVIDVDGSGGGGSSLSSEDIIDVEVRDVR